MPFPTFLCLVCYNCTQITNLESRVRTLEAKLLRTPSGRGFPRFADDSDDEEGGPLDRPIRMGKPDVSHVTGHPLNNGEGRRPLGGRGSRGPAARGRNGGRYGGRIGRNGRRRFGGLQGGAEGNGTVRTNDNFKVFFENNIYGVFRNWWEVLNNNYWVSLITKRLHLDSYFLF